MSVVGFDLGNESSIVVVARRRVIDTIQNEVGNRKTPSIVAFGDKQRYIGEDAVAQYASNSANTVFNFKRFLGRAHDDPELAEEAKFCDFQIVPEKDGGYVAAQVKYLGQKEVFRPEQITAAMLQRLKTVAEKGLDGVRVTDCVIGVPPYWTEQQRRALLDAAQIVGLNVLRLLNETTAVALSYGLLRPMPEKEKTLVCFVDVGQSASHVSVVAFQHGKMEVLGTASARNLGGRSFDYKLVEHFIKYVKAKYHFDPSTSAKAMLKLRKECNRVKTILSANVLVQFAVEFLMNDTDVKGEIQRSEFEAMSQPLLEELIATVDEALRLSKVSKEQLTTIEIVGGASRIPCVQRALEQHLGKELSKTCDGDESVAKGCALQCAMLSPNFQVRPYELVETNTYSMDLSWHTDPSVVEGSTPLFAQQSLVPQSKLITFKNRDKPFVVQLSYAPGATPLPPGTKPLIGQYVIRAPGGPLPVADARVKVKACLDANMMPVVQSAQELREEMAPDAASTANDASPASGDTMEVDANGTKPAAAAPAKKTLRYDVRVDYVHVLGATPQQTTAFAERESQMFATDKAVADTLNARNSLESYVLEMRNQFTGVLAPYVVKAQSDSFCQRCTEIEDWLQDEGYDAQRSEYTDRLDSLRATGDAVARRHFEATNRDSYANQLRRAVEKHLAWAQDPQLANAAPNDKQQFLDECAAAVAWVDSTMAQLAALPPTQDPPVTCQNISQRMAALDEAAAKLKLKAAAKPKAKPAKSAPEAKDAPAEADPAPAASGDAEMSGNA